MTIRAQGRQTEFRFLLLVIVVAGLAARFLSWPGFATHDTIFVTREAMLGEYTTYHPLLNAMLIRWLAVPFDSFWLYSSLQIAFSCTLLYQSFGHVLHERASRRMAIATILLWAISVHTMLYLGTIWKDIPIAYALVFMASLAYHLRVDPDYKVSRLDAFLLGASLLFCLGLRHGMVFNAVLVPLLIGWQRVRSDRMLWIPIVFALVGFAGLKMLSATPLVKNDEAHLLKLKISVVSQPFLGIITNKNGYTSDDHAYDRRLAERAFGNAYDAEYTPDYFRNNVTPGSMEELEGVYRAILKRTPRLCATNFSLCVSARLQMFLGSLQPSTSFGGMTFYDLGAIGKCEGLYGMSESMCDVLDEFVAAEKPQAALRMQLALQSHFVDSRQAVVRLWTWNLLPALALLAAALVLGRAFSPLWLVTGFFTMQLALPFMTTTANDFRYYYFLFPFAVVFGPVMFAQAFKSCRWSRR